MFRTAFKRRMMRKVTTCPRYILHFCWDTSLGSAALQWIVTKSRVPGGTDKPHFSISLTLDILTLCCQPNKK
jgi:hypothetical protein